MNEYNIIPTDAIVNGAQGICIIVDKEPLFGNRLIDELESVRRGKETIYDACNPHEEDQEDVLWTRRSYCLLSTMPDFTQHVRFLEDLIEGRTAQPHDRAEFFIPELERYMHSREPDPDGAGERPPAMGCERQIAQTNEDRMFSHILANEEDAYSKKHLRESSSLLFTVRILCDRLSLDDILAFIAAVLCEKSVIVLADAATGVHVLASVVLSIIPLIWPYEYQSVLMPFVPRLMEDVIDAPVPYVIGCIGRDDVLARMQTESSFDSVVVDIVDGKVFMPQQDASSSHGLPPRLNDHDTLRQNLTGVYDLLSSRPKAGGNRGWMFFGGAGPSTSGEPLARNERQPAAGADLFSLPEREGRLCTEFCSILSNHLISIARRAATYTITDVRGNDRRSVLLEDSFIKSYASGKKKVTFFSGRAQDDEADSNFIAAFINTQIFMDYYRGNRPPSTMPV